MEQRGTFSYNFRYIRLNTSNELRLSIEFKRVVGWQLHRAHLLLRQVGTSPLRWWIWLHLSRFS